ncbi:MAG TPA: Gfo/Idh/MocA family oxidoreductase [Bryobacteraceae bacterium]|jgi:predicted dehydrogenase
MKVGIIGCGLIGQKRARALQNAELAVCCDISPDRASSLARQYNTESCTDWTQVVDRPDVDLVIVATTHDLLPVIATAAAASGKHVLMEKPGARRAEELDPLLEISRRTKTKVRVGFNHRFHRGLQKAHQLVAAGELGPLMFLRGRYGHGGRPGYDKEWRAIRDKSGGGELVDQGCHLIDLSRWFLNAEFTKVQGVTATYFWEMPVEDNGFLLLQTDAGQTAFLHATWTEWKNLFSLEIYGRTGKIEINGLGGSYGAERVTYYKMYPELGPPETFAWEYPMTDNSWDTEFQLFLEDIRLDREPDPGILDAQAALRVIEGVYRSNA